MKKLIAMLLCVALVAAMGVTSFADFKATNEDSSRYWGHMADDDAAAATAAQKKSNLAAEVEALWKDYEEILHSDDHTQEEKDMAKEMLKSDLEVLGENKRGLDAKLFDAESDPNEMIVTANQAKKDAAKDAADKEKDVANDTYKENYYAKKAAADKDKAADNAAKAAAWNAYLASDRTDLDAAIYEVAVANVDAQRALANAKAAVADAKAEFAQAQKTWKDTVNVKVAEAQADYYVAVAAAYNDAVSEAVAAIYDALG